MKKRTYLLLTLGMLTALAPVINNMFSPAMTDLVTQFGIDSSVAQLGLTASLAGLAMGQIIIGPLSDRLGRYRPLLASMLLLTIASLACALSTSINSLVTTRFVQGIAAGGGIVIARSVATDINRGSQLIKALAFINVFNGLAPIVTPILGGVLASHAGWQGPMWAMLVVAIALSLACSTLPETLPADRRVSLGYTEIIGLFARVMRNKMCLYTILHQGCALACLFGNIAITPFLVIHYGHATSDIGYALGVNGIFTAIGAGFAGGLGSAERGMRITSAGLVACGCAMAVVLLGDMGFWAYEAVVSIMLFFVGITLTSSSSHAMEQARDEAGAASALLGAVGFVVGAVVAPLMSVGNWRISTATVFLLSALLTCTFTHIALKQAPLTHRS